VLTSALLYAQTETTGEVAGTVTDPTGASVGNGTVTVKSDVNGETQTAATSTEGRYRVALLRPGAYTVSVKAAGFEETVQKVTVSLGQILNVNFQLGLAKQSQVVYVTEQAPLTQTEDANLTTTFNSNQLDNLPAPGNDMTAYAFTAPGVTISTGAGYGNFSAFGLPGVSNLYTINGTDNMDPYLNLNNSGASNLTLGANEIQEAAVVLNGYTGQYGRQAGAQVNYITKSGGNTFHGNAVWEWNGNDLNANDWFNNASATDRPHAVSNEWADSIGGPILKNKLFFFFDNEGLRYVLPGGGQAYIPTTDFASYVLSHLQATNSAAVPIYTTAMSLYNGASGAGRSTPVTSDVDSALGCGDFAGTDGWGTGSKACARGFRSTVNNLNEEWLMAIKGDWYASSKDQIYLRYNQDHGVQATGTDPINAIFNANSVQPSYGGQFGYTRTISPTMTNNLLLSASYYSAIFGPPNIAASLKAFPTTFTFADGLYSNMGGSDTSYPQGRKVRQWQLLDDYSLVHGSHSFKFGTNIRKNFIATYATFPNTSGLYTFFSMTDFVNGSLDNGSTYSQNFQGVGAEPLSMYSAGFYGQDEWRVRQNLTLTLTLRMDRNSNISCGNGCFNEFSSAFQQLSHDSTVPYNAVDHTGITHAFPSVEPVVFEPRVGFAYSLRNSTVLRGGFGIFSDLYQGLIADRFITNTPSVSSFTASSGLVAPGNPNSAQAIVTNSNNALQSGFASGATVAQLLSQVAGFARPNFNTIAPKLYNPKYYEWNFEVQQSFGANYMFSVNYVGNKGYQEINENLFLNAFSAAGFAGLPTSRPDGRFGEIRELNNDGYSNYNGLVAAFKWRLGSQFAGQFAYTWSHALDTCSNECLEPFNASTAVSLRYQISPFGLSNLNYSNADYDVRHTVSANYVYTVPTSYFGNSILKNVLGGWTAAGTVFFHGGYPFSIVDSGVRSANGISGASGLATQIFIADWIGGAGYPSCTTPNVSCYTASQFLTAAQQHNFGNIPRNSFRGPSYFDTDLDVNKAFTLHERFKLVIGANFFNVLNHPNFDLPVNNLALGNFGAINLTVSSPSSAYGSFQGSAVSGRVIQTSVKFQF
jgi:hypothetical protein